MTKKILLIPSMGYAHVTRILELGKYIKDLADVEIVIGEQFSRLAREADISTRVINHPNVNYQKIAKGNLSIFTASELDAMARDYDRIIDDSKPDVVITSAAVCAGIPVRKRGIERVALVDACLTPYSLSPIRVTLDYALRSILHRVRPSLEKVVDVLPYGVRDLSVPRSLLAGKITSQINEVAEKWDLPTVDSVLELLQGDTNLMPDLPTLLPVQEHCPENYTYMGPLTWKGDGSDKGVVINRDRPLVYVSMGSSGHAKHLELLARCLSKTDYQVVMTTGGVANAKDLADYERDGFYIRDFLPGAKVVSSSDNTIVICHGGLGTVYQAFEAGARGIVAIPAHPEHTLVADRLEQLSLGQHMWPEEIKGLGQVLDRMFGSPFSQSNAYGNIQTEIEHYQEQAPTIIRGALRV